MEDFISLFACILQDKALISDECSDKRDICIYFDGIHYFIDSFFLKDLLDIAELLGLEFEFWEIDED